MSFPELGVRGPSRRDQDAARTTLAGRQSAASYTAFREAHQPAGGSRIPGSPKLGPGSSLGPCPTRTPTPPAPSTGPHGLLSFIDASPSPYHAARSAAARLSDDGFVLLDETDAWPSRARALRRGAGRQSRGLGSQGRERPVAGVPPHRRPHRQSEPADQASPGHAAAAAIASSASRCTAASCSTAGSTATSACRVECRCATAGVRSTREFRRRPAAAAGPAARDPPRPGRQRRAEAQPPAAPRAGVGPRPARRGRVPPLSRQGARRHRGRGADVGRHAPRPHAVDACSASTTSS